MIYLALWMEIGGAKSKFFQLSILSQVILCGFSLSAEPFEIVVKRSPHAPARSGALVRATTNTSSSLDLLKFDTQEDYLRAVDELRQSGVEFEKNAKFRGDLTNGDIEFDLSSFDEYIGNQWSLINRGSISSNTFGGADVDALRAWSLSQGGGRLYVIDSGIDQRAADISSRLVDRLSAIDGSGPEDENGHGTHVSSIAAAAQNNIGIMGVAPGNVEVVSIRMLDAENAGNTFTAVRAYELLRDNLEEYLSADPNRFAVISNSWGGPEFSGSLQQAMQAVMGPRVFIVTSAGNENNDNDRTPYYPCNFNLVNNVCVAASDRDDSLAGFSSFGKNSVHLLAPGRQILSAIPGILSGNTYTNMWGEKSGTSQATPHVAGAALVAWAANPSLNASDIKAIILQSVDRIPGAENQVLAGGRLNVYRAALMATGNDPSLADRGFLTTNKKSGGGGCNATPRADHSAFFLVLLVLALYSVFRIRHSVF